jgi:hypothetical protein
VAALAVMLLLAAAPGRARSELSSGSRPQQSHTAVPMQSCSVVSAALPPWLHRSDLLHLSHLYPAVTTHSHSSAGSDAQPQQYGLVRDLSPSAGLCHAAASTPR